jgi:hypothetical protein
MAKTVRLCDSSIMDTVTALLLGSASAIIVATYVLHVDELTLSSSLGGDTIKDEVTRKG